MTSHLHSLVTSVSGTAISSAPIPGTPNSSASSMAPSAALGTTDEPVSDGVKAWNDVGEPVSEIYRSTGDPSRISRRGPDAFLHRPMQA